MNQQPSTNLLTIIFFLLFLGVTAMYMIAESDNQYLEQRYHQCSGKYV